MTFSMIMRNNSESLVCGTVVCGLAMRPDAPPLLALVAEHVVLTSAHAALQLDADCEAGERELQMLSAAVTAEEASFDTVARSFVRTVTLPSGSIAHAVNRECFGDMAMTEVLLARREQKLMRFALYASNLGRRTEVTFDHAGLTDLRKALARLQVADSAAYAIETRVTELRASRREAFATFESDYARFANAARALWGREAMRQWLPVFLRADTEERTDDPFTVEGQPEMDNDDVQSVAEEVAGGEVDGLAT